MSEPASAAIPVVEWGAACAPLRGESVAGDVYVVATFDGGALAAVIDGLGHGPEARRAAAAAAEVLEANPSEPPSSLVRACHEALRHTRGAVLTVVRFEAERSTMEWVGVGNVGGLMVRCGGSSTSREAVAAPGGVVGYQLPPLRTVRLPLSWGDTVVLTSDGIRGDFERDLVEMDDVQSTAEQVLARHGRVNDDACVLVVRYLGLVNQRVAVRHDSDIVVVRRAVRRISREQGLPEPDAEALATAVTEIAQNILVHAEMGELFLGPVREASRRGVMAVARDRGPGIADPARALVDGFTTGAGLGLGLPSAKRLVDDFSLISDPLAGTVVTLRKWRR